MADLNPKSSPRPSIVIQVEEQPKLTVFHTISIMISSIGGSAVFVAMTTIIANTHSIFLTLVSFLLSGLLNLSLSMCFAEVAVLLPKAGGPYFFVMAVYGNFPAFLFMWGFVLFIISPVWALLSFVSSLYVVQLFFPGCRPPDVAVKLLAICILVAIVALNCLYLKYVTKVQAFLSSSKLLAMVLIICCGVYAVYQGEIENFKDFFEGTQFQPGEWALSILAGMFIYGGWQIITFLLEEMEDPAKNLPKALGISFALVISLNMLVVMTYFTLIPPADMLDADAVAVLFMERLYFPLAPVISLFVTSTCIGSLNAIVLAHSRLVSTAAKMHHLPSCLATSSEKYKMPWAATIFLSTLAIIILVSGSLIYIIEMVSFYAVVMGLAVLLCLFGLRVQRPKAKRTIKVWLATAIFQFVLNFAILVMSIYQKPTQFGQMVLIVATGIPVYAIFIQWKTKPKVLSESADKFCLVLQKLLMLKFD